MLPASTGFERNVRRRLEGEEENWVQIEMLDGSRMHKPGRERILIAESGRQVECRMDQIMIGMRVFVDSL